MAVLSVMYTSEVMHRNVNFKVILPVENADRPEKFPTLYLLHGYYGNESDWINGTRVEMWARERNLAVVMPAGDNGFYLDQEEKSIFYGSFVGKELVEATRKMFPLSDKKEDTFIGGLSMGGFGAMLLGARFAETFGGIISMSGAFLVSRLKNNGEITLPLTPVQLEYTFGDLATMEGSDRDPLALAKKAQEKGLLAPVFLTCGTKDSLYQYNVEMREDLEAIGAEVTWEEADYDHEWLFWDLELEHALDWIIELRK